MMGLNKNRIPFYEFLNNDTKKEQFEKWVYENSELETELGEEQYVELISYNFRNKNLISFIKNIVKAKFDWMEYEKWRTIKLLQKIKDGNIEIVLATLIMNRLFYEQEKENGKSFLPKSLGVGCASELDGIPLESQYHLWNKDALKNQLNRIDLFKNGILKEVEEILISLENTKYT